MRTRLLLATIAAALAATAAPVAAQDEEPEQYEDEYGDEEYYGEEEFCGGGEETPFDEAYMYYDMEEYGDARDTLVSALQSHDYYSEMRPAYLVLLGLTQMRLDDSRHAAVNFSRAIAAAPDDADMNGARIGLAVALAERGDRRRALESATQFIDARCTSESTAPIQCYVANVVLGSVGRDDETRGKGRIEAERLRTEMRDYERAGIEFYDELFEVAEWTATAEAPEPPESNTEDSGDESA